MGVQMANININVLCYHNAMPDYILLYKKAVVGRGHFVRKKSLAFPLF